MEENPVASYDLGDMKLAVDPVGETLIITHAFVRERSEERKVVGVEETRLILEEPFSPDLADENAVVMVRFKGIPGAFDVKSDMAIEEEPLPRRGFFRRVRGFFSWR